MGAWARRALAGAGRDAWLGVALTLLALAPAAIVVLPYALFFNLGTWYPLLLAALYGNLGYRAGRRAGAAVPPAGRAAWALGGRVARAQALAIAVAVALLALPLALLYGAVLRRAGSGFDTRATGFVLEFAAGFLLLSIGVGLTLGTLLAGLGVALAWRRAAPPPGP